MRHGLVVCVRGVCLEACVRRGGMSVESSRDPSHPGNKTAPFGIGPGANSTGKPRNRVAAPSN